MDPAALRFLCFSLFSALCLAGGYGLRRRGTLGAARTVDLSRQVHFVTVVIVFPVVAVVSLWRLPIRPATAQVAMLESASVVVAGFLMLAMVRRTRWSRPQQGTMTLAAAMGNLGFTLGAYLCYSLIEPADEALAYGVAMVSVMQVTGIVVFYPVARFLGDGPSDEGSMVALVVRSLLDVRAMMLYGAALGAGLAAIDAPYPATIDRLYVKDMLFFLGGGLAYFGIGLRLEFGRPLRFWRHQLALAATRFLFVPALVWLLLLGLEAAAGRLPDTARQVLLVEAFMPTAIAMVMLSNLFRLDVALGSSLWLWNTVLFLAIPLPVIVLVLRHAI